MNSISNLPSNSQPICLFDSGIGGFSVLKKLLEKFPNESYIYLADLARVPYGDKNREEIRIIANEIINWLLQFNPKVVIMACNTSSAIFLSENMKQYSIPVLGMIEPVSEELALSNKEMVTVWATKLVIENQSYFQAINKKNPKIKVQEIACPKLVPMIEGLNCNQNERMQVIQEYIDKTNPDSKAIILGCTHYPLIQEEIKKHTDKEIIDPAYSLLKEVEKHLSIKGNNSSKPVELQKTNLLLYTTADAQKIEKSAKAYLHVDTKVKCIELNNLQIKI